jgi:hypothetical protein
MGLDIGEISGGSKSFPFEEIGDRVGGRIRTVERRQQRSFDGGAPLTWDDGSPRMLTYIELETELHDDNEDDGLRAVYCKGGQFEVAEGQGRSAEQALVEAARQAGVKTIEEGGTLRVVFSGRSKPTTRGYQPAKLFVMQYEPPRSSVSTDDLFEQG